MDGAKHEASEHESDRIGESQSCGNNRDDGGRDQQPDEELDSGIGRHWLTSENTTLCPERAGPVRRHQGQWSTCTPVLEKSHPHEWPDYRRDGVDLYTR